VSGQLVDAAGPRVSFLVAGAAGLVVTAVVWARRGTLQVPTTDDAARTLTTV
jgi:hypothetical protein